MLSTQVVQEPGIGALTFDDEIRNCTIDEVCAVRVGDRVLVLPIDAELAAVSGFEVISIDSKYLTSIGVKPRVSGANPQPSVSQQAGSGSVPNLAGLADDNTVVSDPSVPEERSAPQSPGVPTLASLELPTIDGLSGPRDTPPAAGGPTPDVAVSTQSISTQSISTESTSPESMQTKSSEPSGGGGPADASGPAGPENDGLAPNHPLHQEDPRLIGTLETKRAVSQDKDRRSDAPWASALQDTFVDAPTTPTAEAVAEHSTTTPSIDAAPVHGAIAAQLVDWSVLDAVVEPARPLDVAGANRDDGSSLSQVGWPEIDRRAPEILDTAPAAFNPFAETGRTKAPGNRAGDQPGARVAGPLVAPNVSNPIVETPSVSVTAEAPSLRTDAVSVPGVGSTVPKPSETVRATGSVLPTGTLPPTGTQPEAEWPGNSATRGPVDDAGSLTAVPQATPSDSPQVTHSTPFDAPRIGSAVFASVVASQLVVPGTAPLPEGYTGISFVLAPGEAMEVRGDDADVLALFRTLAGFVDPRSGSLDVDGEERSSLASTERARREALYSGALFDSPVLIPERSAAANLEIPLRAAGIAPATAAAMTASRIDTMGLTVLGPHRIDALSSDLRVLVGAARSLIMPSPLVVVAMDTRPLADETVKWLHALVDQARRGGAAIVYRTQDPRFSFENSRVAAFAGGVLVPVAAQSNP